MLIFYAEANSTESCVSLLVEYVDVSIMTSPVMMSPLSLVSILAPKYRHSVSLSGRGLMDISRGGSLSFNGERGSLFTPGASSSSSYKYRFHLK